MAMVQLILPPPPSTHRQRWGGWKSVLATEVVEKAHLGPEQHPPIAQGSMGPAEATSMGPQVQKCPPYPGAMYPQPSPAHHWDATPKIPSHSLLP